MNGGPTYTTMHPGLSTTEEPTPRLRWLRIVGSEPRLQQYWSIKTYVGMSCEGMHGEWRDVPDAD